MISLAYYTSLWGKTCLILSSSSDSIKNSESVFSCTLFINLRYSIGIDRAPSIKVSANGTVLGVITDLSAYSLKLLRVKLATGFG